MDPFDEPDPFSSPAQAPLDPLKSNVEFANDSYEPLSTPINTMNYFDEPEPNGHSSIHQESSASPPAPSATLPSVIDMESATKPVDVIPEDTEKDEYRDGDEDDDDNDHNEEEEDVDDDADDYYNKYPVDQTVEQSVDDDDEEVEDVENDENMAKLEADLEAIRTKLEQIKIENMVYTQEMTKSAKQTSLINEYDKKIMEYDKEFNEQQRFIEEEEKLIEALQREFEEKIAKHNIDESQIKSEMNSNGVIRNGGNNKHAQKSSIVLYDNSFAINHQLQLEIDKLTNQIEWLQQSKIELVKNTANEVDRLRSIIKQFQRK